MKRCYRAIPLLAVIPALACTVLMRDPSYYHYDVMKALEPREEALKVCYDTALEVDDRAAGAVVAAFTVEKKTGVIKDIQVVEGKTTAPPLLAKCVTAQLEGLTIEAPDAQDGVAEYQWDFVLNIDEEELEQPNEAPAEAPDQGVAPSSAPETGASHDTEGPESEAAENSEPETESADESEPEPEVTFEIGE